MRVEVYRGSNNLFGLTTEPLGNNLPTENGPWVHQGRGELRITDGCFYRIDTPKALWDITSRGFHLTQLVDMHTRLG
jgi:hypothetical protein